MILLDDVQSTTSQPTSRLYRQALRDWSVYASEDQTQTKIAIDECLGQINSALKQGQYVVTAFAYELGRYIDDRLPQRLDSGMVI
jgi:hypothetical protein